MDAVGKGGVGVASIAADLVGRPVALVQRVVCVAAQQDVGARAPRSRRCRRPGRRSRRPPQAHRVVAGEGGRESVAGQHVGAGAAGQPLLAPTAQVRKRAARLHDGTITVSIPDTLWATDAAEGWSAEGRSAVFAIIDHASGEVWADASLRMDRWAAADLLREVTSERFGSVEQAVAAGLALRYDGGPCFRCGHYQAEIDHLGIARSPAYHDEPETNGCIERFMGVLKEQVLWIERFDTHEQLRARVREFARTYNQSWLLERHAYRTPIEAREHPLHQALVT
jgi:transposase InsO family protein